MSARDVEERHDDDWRAGWEDQEALTLERSLAVTPAQRLAWLEEAIRLAWASGALPRKNDAGGETPER